LKLKHEDPLSNFACNVILRRYTKSEGESVSEGAGAARSGIRMDGRSGGGGDGPPRKKQKGAHARTAGADTRSQFRST